MNIHNMTAREWGWAHNQVNGFVLLENAFPDDNEANHLIEERIVCQLPGDKEDHADLNCKVCLWY